MIFSARAATLDKKEHHVADGEEERKQQQQQREQETWRQREDRLDRDHPDPWQPERDDS
ncbi:MAG TPA: hypothetical protein VN151_01395 [Terracidiphilus sp.]|nr:hypothetical protein [Terracidiphilus sp.]